MQTGVSITTKEELHQVGITGKGIKVAIIDTGFAKSNDNLVIKEIVLKNQEKRYTEHATACASIIKSKEFGIAVNCELYSLSIGENKNSVNCMKTLADKIYWCVDNGIKLINLSLAFGSVNENISCPDLLKACQYADDKGVILVAGAGNYGIEEKDKEYAYMTSPANYGYVIGISNVDVNTNKIASSSSRGLGIDFAGYGDGNKAYNLNGETFKFSGTSSAGPYVTGCITLMLQQLNNKPNREEIYNILKFNSLKLDNQYKSPLYGYGLVKPIKFETRFKYTGGSFLSKRFVFKNAYFKERLINMHPGDEKRLDIIFTPDNESSFISFESSNDDIATVDYQRPYIKALREGVCTITGMLFNGKIIQTVINVIPENNNKVEDVIQIHKYDTLEKLGVYECWDNGYKGKGIKVGFMGYGCIDTDLIPVFKNYCFNNDLVGFDCNGGLGTQLSSIITGKNNGIAPECIFYNINPCVAKSGGTNLYQSNSCARWAETQKLDILFIRDILTDDKRNPSKYTICKTPAVTEFLQKLHDDGTIVVSIVNDNSNVATSDGDLSIITKSPNVLTVSVVDNDQNFVQDSECLTNEYVDCVSYAYPYVIDITRETIQLNNKIIKSIHDKQFLAAAQICGILALLKQQNSELKTAQDIRKLLPQLCKPLYGGKNNKTGYGLLQAKIL